MPENLKLSFIIPVYNRENTIERCIDSIWKQMEDNTEIIVVDDGSTDRTQEILKQYEKDAKIRVEYCEHGGVGKARNRGIAVAKGEYLTFVDSDDFIGEGYIHMLLEDAKANSDIVIYDKWYKINAHGTVYTEAMGIRIRGVCVSQELYPYLVCQCLNSAWGKLFKKSMVMDADLLFPEKMLIGEDFMFVIGYLENCVTAKVCDEISYYYEHNPAGTWNAKQQHLKDLIYIYEKIADFIEKKDIRFISSEWNLEKVHSRALRNVCSVIKGLYDREELSEEMISGLLKSRMYRELVGEKYHRVKYRFLRYCIKKCNWDLLSFALRVKGKA